MAKKNSIIKARYQEGTLRPLKKLDLPEGSVVEIILDPEDPKKVLDELFKKFHDRNRDIPPEKIERDIEAAIKEVREENRLSRKSAGRAR